MTITQSKIIFIGNPTRELTVEPIASTHTILAMVGRHEGGLQIMMLDLTQVQVRAAQLPCHGAVHSLFWLHLRSSAHETHSSARVTIGMVCFEHNLDILVLSTSSCANGHTVDKISYVPPYLRSPVGLWRSRKSQSHRRPTMVPPSADP